MFQRLLKRNGIIFLLAFLFCLPCPTKRELKKVFDIPVSEVVKFDVKKGQCISTYEFTTDQTSNAKDFKSNFTFFSTEEHFTFQTLHYRKHSEHWLNDYKLRTSKVPIFIHHEQYRI